MPSALEQARAALAFYRDTAWDVDGDQGYDHDDNIITVVTCDPSDELLADRGERAREALARLSALTPPDETEWARVIDPEAWEPLSALRPEPCSCTDCARRRKFALAKARTLIGMAGGVK